MATSASTKTVWAAVIGNLLVALTKIVAAVFSGSAAMASEAVHSIVDTGNEVLLLYGMGQSKRRPDAVHPFGYGRELYFWSFIVAVLLFGLGCVASVVQGIGTRHPSRPRTVCPLRAQIGSWSTATGRSSTLGRPSS